MKLYQIERLKQNTPCQHMQKSWLVTTADEEWGKDKFHKDNSLLNLITVRDGNDVEPEAINIRDIEPVRS